MLACWLLEMRSWKSTRRRWPASVWTRWQTSWSRTSLSPFGSFDTRGHVQSDNHTAWLKNQLPTLNLTHLFMAVTELKQNCSLCLTLSHDEKLLVSCWITLTCWCEYLFNAMQYLSSELILFFVFFSILFYYYINNIIVVVFSWSSLVFYFVCVCFAFVKEKEKYCLKTSWDLPKENYSKWKTHWSIIEISQTGLKCTLIKWSKSVFFSFLYWIKKKKEKKKLETYHTIGHQIILLSITDL